MGEEGIVFIIAIVINLSIRILVTWCQLTLRHKIDTNLAAYLVNVSS